MYLSRSFSLFILCNLIKVTHPVEWVTWFAYFIGFFGFFGLGIRMEDLIKRV